MKRRFAARGPFLQALERFLSDSVEALYLGRFSRTMGIHQSVGLDFAVAEGRYELPRFEAVDFDPAAHQCVDRLFGQIVGEDDLSAVTGLGQRHIKRRDVDTAYATED